MLEDRQRDIFFIIGPPRSGTSILQEVMNTFDNFCNIGESRIYGTQIHSLWTPVRKSKNFLPLEEYIQKNWSRKYFVEKTPDSILCLSSLLDKFPHANYLF